MYLNQFVRLFVLLTSSERRGHENKRTVFTDNYRTIPDGY